jgi:hypothetical protein
MTMLSTRNLPRTRLALAAVACLTGLLAGCGAANEANDANDANDAAGANSATSNAAASGGTADQKYDAWEQKFRSCLSGKGFELPKEAAGHIDFGARQDQYEVAEEACLKQIGKPPTADDGPKLTPQELQALNLKRAQCLRDRGYDVKDPKPGVFVWPSSVSNADVEGCLNP